MTTTTRPPITYQDIEPAVLHPAFTPGRSVIMRIDLPTIGVQDCCPASLIRAGRYIEDISRWVLCVHRQGHTPVVSLWSDGVRALIAVDSLRVVPVAQA